MAPLQADQNYRVINELNTGCYFGEIALLSNLKRTFSISAINNVVVGTLSKANFRNFIKEH